MPFGRPRIANHGLESEFKVIKAIVVAEGCNNAGIYKVLHHKTNVVCIEKRFIPEHIYGGLADAEMDLLRSLKHENISEYVHGFIEDGYAARASLYMDFCDMGSLNDTLEKYAMENRGISEGFVWSAFKQLANALGYIQFGDPDVVYGDNAESCSPYWPKIIHRDIYPRNIFLKKSSTNIPRVVLGDFGVAIQVPLSMEDLDPRPYTWVHPMWAPPEMHFGVPSDIFCIGGIIQEMCRLDGPAKRYGLFKNGRHFKGAEQYSSQLNKTIRRFMEQDWHMRPKIRAVAPMLAEWEAEAKAEYDKAKSGYSNEHSGWYR